MPTGKIRNSLVFEALRKFSLLLGHSSERLENLFAPFLHVSEWDMYWVTNMAVP